MKKNFIPIKKEFNPEDITILSSSTHITGLTLLFDLSEASYRMLDTLFLVRPELVLEIPFTSYFDNVSFCRFLPNLCKISCRSPYVEAIEDLQFCPKLNYIHLGEFKNSSLSLDVLKSFEQLTHLSIAGNKKHIKKLATLQKLTFLNLESVTLDKNNFLELFTQLKGLRIYQGRLMDISFLKLLPKLEYLELNDISNLRNLSSISSLPSLSFLHLEDLSFVRTLDWMNEMPSLTHFSLYNLNRLSDIKKLPTAQNLHTFLVTNSSLDAKDFAILPTMPQLKEVFFEGKERIRPELYPHHFELLSFSPSKRRNDQFITSLLQ